MSVGFITHDEAMINRFTKDTEYADELLSDVIYGGDIDEIQHVKMWYDEAKKRRCSPDYWDSLAENVKIAIRDGNNLQLILSRLNEATKNVKAAMA